MKDLLVGLIAFIIIMASLPTKAGETSVIFQSDLEVAQLFNFGDKDVSCEFKTYLLQDNSPVGMFSISVPAKGDAEINLVPGTRIEWQGCEEER